MRISLLTSSRADFGIQLPLLRLLSVDPYFDLSVIAFGSHSDPRFGNTIEEIRRTGFGPAISLPPVLRGDRPEDITLAMADTFEQFHAIWRDHGTDMIIALGDRYEMFAAVAASVPFDIPVAHLHGGETTLGAIDNSFRHSITHMSTLHFTAAEPYSHRVQQLTNSAKGVHFTGALSIDNLVNMERLSIEAIREFHGIDMNLPTVLVTYHPETKAHHKLDEHWFELSKALDLIAKEHQILATLPNADTRSLHLREKWKRFASEHPSVIAVDSLGSVAYLSCMEHSRFMLGNSSSGYIEASFFQKPVIDVGERQTGRIVTPNIHRCPVSSTAIMDAVRRIQNASPPAFRSPYGNGHAAEHMIRIMKQFK